MPIPLVAIVLLLVIAGCGRIREHVIQDRQPGAAPAQPGAGVPRTDPSLPAARRQAPLDCDPRVRDPDRGRVGMGLLAGDCQDDRGRNRAYVTRLVTVQGAPSPAQAAGVQAGDRLVQLDACEIASTADLVAQLRSAPPGWVARVVVERGGREVETFVPTIKLPDNAAPPGPPQLSTAGCRAIGRPAAK